MLQSPTETRERPVTGYAALLTAFTGLTAAFAAWFRASGRKLPERMAAQDIAVGALATQKLARLLAKERVTSPIRAPFIEDGAEAETPAGTGLRRAIGELILCPYCLNVWLAAVFTGALLVVPRPTRWVAAVFATLFGADALQLAYKRALDTR